MATSVEHIVAKSDLQRTGVLLEIWDIADTANAFYQGIDYLYNGDVPPYPPEPPTDDLCYDREILTSVGYARSICDCHKFYQLANGVAVLMSCQMPLVFDPTSNTCNWRELVDITGVQNCS